ncbi:hypothetical protein CC99x_007750 [Candidatus Berkiella cookevillensis]|uniref:Uncharacterized protein n=1 Tax=Candidatus Berkiella cookevillensis TaxID=437022 RepID=A0A0Q9YKI7_9GAMM|nr:hypothetical protein [Candidatus Berkiella cookevillensis]MCS5708796.1 hypothetical protein [Candidatus Berkiella cookevillensis]
MLNISLALIFMLILIPFSANAYDQSRAKNNFSYELAECSVYFLLISEAASRKKKTQEGDELSIRYRDAGEALLEGAISFSHPETAVARAELLMKEMIADIDNNFENISILMNKYMSQCEQIYEKSEERLQYWLDQ